MKQPFALVIEDDTDLSTIFAAALQAAEFDTEIVSDGGAAIERLSASRPALVVLDLHLPNTSGKDILAHIRANEKLADTRVILATADALLAESLRGDADLVLLKPISFHQLRDLASRLRPRGEML